MSVPELAGVVGVAVLLGLTAYLAAVETVLNRLALVRALRLREEEADGGEPLLWLLEHRATSLSVHLLLTVTIRTATAVIAGALAIRWLGEVPGAVVAIAVVAVLGLLLAEIAPRTLTLRRLEASGLRLGPSFAVAARALEPVARLLVSVARSLGGRNAAANPYATDEEPRDEADVEEDDEIEEDERAMIRSIFELGDTTVREIMVPRPDMVTVDQDAPLRDLVNTILEHGYSRIPVHRGSKDDVVGVVYAKDVLRRVALQPSRERWDDLVRPATFVPETKRVGDLLRDLQAQTVHLAIVVDEYGALVGLVTIEDVLEEIVGEIVDEHDVEAPLVEVLDDERMRVDARLPVDDLNELLDVDLPDEGWDTVGGLVLGSLGRVPSPGDSVELEGVTLTAERVQGRRVSKVLISRPARGDGEGP